MKNILISILCIFVLITIISFNIQASSANNKKDEKINVGSGLMVTFPGHLEFKSFGTACISGGDDCLIIIYL